MTNPALEIWRSVYGSDAPFGWYDRMKSRARAPLLVEAGSLVKEYSSRRFCTTRFAWAIPDPDTVAYLATFSPLIELGAGAGLWASLIAAAGGDVVAFDRAPGGNDWLEADAPKFFDVRQGGDEQLDLHPNRMLFLCWPTMRWPLTETLARYKGRTLLYIGEANACTGWCEELDDESKWEVAERRDIPQWNGINDHLMVFKRAS